VTQLGVMVYGMQGSMLPDSNTGTWLIPVPGTDNKYTCAPSE
jgi:hypothetical protein